MTRTGDARERDPVESPYVTELREPAAVIAGGPAPRVTAADSIAALGICLPPSSRPHGAVRRARSALSGRHTEYRRGIPGLSAGWDIYLVEAHKAVPAIHPVPLSRRSVAVEADDLPDG